MPYRADPWPRKTDSALDRARAVAREYRDALGEVDPGRCARLDAVARKLGQAWVVPQLAQYEPDDLLPPLRAAEFCHIRPGTLPAWRRNGLQCVNTPDGTRYRVRDLLDYQASQRLKRLRGKQSAGRS